MEHSAEIGFSCLVLLLVNLLGGFVIAVLEDSGRNQGYGKFMATEKDVPR